MGACYHIGPCGPTCSNANGFEPAKATPFLPLPPVETVADSWDMLKRIQKLEQQLGFAIERIRTLEQGKREP